MTISFCCKNEPVFQQHSGNETDIAAIVTFLKTRTFSHWNIYTYLEVNRNTAEVFFKIKRTQEVHGQNRSPEEKFLYHETHIKYCKTHTNPQTCIFQNLAKHKNR